MNRRLLVRVSVSLAALALLGAVFVPWGLETSAGQPPRVARSEAYAVKTISWKNAKNYVGKRVRVKGPVKSTKYAKSSSGKPTFLNVGKAYPSRKRFTVVIWGENRAKFKRAPEKMYRGKTIAVTGTIRLYKGLPEMIVTSPKQIKVVN